MMAGPQEHNRQLDEAGRGWRPKGQPLGGGSSHAAHLQYSHAKTQRPPMASRPRRKPPTPEKSSAKVKRGGGGVTGGGVAAASSLALASIANTAPSYGGVKDGHLPKPGKEIIILFGHWPQ